jgi:hypothetical protein
LDQLASPGFDPEKTLLVSSGIGVPEPGIGTNQNPGEVKFTSYAPKDILLSTAAKEDSILLLNDRFDTNWKVLVDGKPGTVLRCNYIMRGVHLNPGNHLVEFRFEPPERAFYVSVAAVVSCVLLCCFLSLPSSPKGSIPGGVRDTNDTKHPVAIR